MRKRILSVLAICAIIACLFSACSIDNSQPGDGRGVGYVTFGNQLTSSARSLTPSYDVAAYEDLYWFYDAVKGDQYGTTGAGNGQKIPGTDGQGLAGEVGPFSQGTWNFTLYAYSDATLSGDSWTPTDGTLVYQGETGNVVITASAVTNIPVSVEPKGETGIVKFGDNAYFKWANGGGDGKPVIKLTLTSTDAESEPITFTVTPNDKNADGELMLEGTLSDSVPVGYYNCHISAYLEKYESTPLAEQEISFRVYGSAAVIIDGDITEGVNSHVSFDVADTSMEVFSGNAGEVTINDVTVDFSSAGLVETSTHYLTLESVSGTSAESLYQSAISVPEDESNRIAVTSLDLTLSQVTSDNNQSAVTEFSEPVTVTTTVASGLENVTVVYDGKEEQPQDVSYTASTGKLSFKTSHFSRFYVLADSRILNVEKGAYYASLADAIVDVDDGETIQLAGDIVLHNQIVFSNRKFTLDLAGHSITPSNDLVLTSGVIYLKNDVDMTIEDSVGSGSIDMSTDRKDANNQYAAIYAAVALMPEGGHSSSLTVNGGTLTGQHYAIAGNGSSGLGETTITINGGTLNSKDGPAIYHPQRGVLIVNDGTLTATDSAIELRSGTLVINGGTFTATESDIDTAPNGSGTTTKGAAIAIAQHTTKFPINVVINGGTFNGFHALYQKNVEKNPQEAIDKISIEVNGGTFSTLGKGTVPVYSENITGFVHGGTFSQKPVDSYIGAGFDVEEVGGKWVVDTIFEDGKGTAQDPFIIVDESQFAKISTMMDAMKKMGNYYYFSIKDDLDFSDGQYNPYIEVFRGELDFNTHTLSGVSSELLSRLNNGTSVSGLIDTIAEGAIRNLVYMPAAPLNLAYCATWPKVHEHDSANGVEVIFENISAGELGINQSFGEVGNNSGFFVSQVLGTNTKMTFRDCTNYYNLNSTTYGGVFLSGYGRGNVEIIFENCDNYGTIYAPKFGYLIGNDSDSSASISAKDCNNKGAIYATEKASFIGWDAAEYEGRYHDLGDNEEGTIKVLNAVDATVTVGEDGTFEISGVDTAKYSSFEVDASGYGRMMMDGKENGTLLLHVSTGVQPIGKLDDLSFRALPFIDSQYASGSTSTEADAYGNTIATVGDEDFYSYDLASIKMSPGLTVVFPTNDHTLRGITYNLYVYDSDGNLAGSKRLSVN